MFATIGTALAKFGAKFGALFASFASVVAKYATIIGAYFLGKRRAEKKNLEDALETKDEQLKILSKPDAHRSTLLERMRQRKRD